MTTYIGPRVGERHLRLDAFYIGDDPRVAGTALVSYPAMHGTDTPRCVLIDGGGETPGLPGLNVAAVITCCAVNIYEEHFPGDFKTADLAAIMAQFLAGIAANPQEKIDALAKAVGPTHVDAVKLHLIHVAFNPDTAKGEVGCGRHTALTAGFPWVTP